MLIKYTGSVSYEEYPVTSFRSLWQPNQVQDVTGSRLTALLDTGEFQTTASETVRQYPSSASFPPAADFGVGVAQAADTGELFRCDANGYVGIMPTISANLGVLGDSIGFLNYDLLTAANVAITSQEGFVTHFNKLRGYKNIITSCQASSGFTAKDTVNTELPILKALTVKPKVIFLSVGANDFFTYSHTSTVVLANVKRILNELAILGITCVVLNGFPRATWHAEYTAGKQTQLFDYLQKIPELVAQFRQHYLIDSYSIASTTGDITGYCLDGWSIDGVHPNQKYATAIGELLHKTLPSSEALFEVGVQNPSDMRGVTNSTSSNIIAASTLSFMSVGSTALPAGFAEPTKTNVTSTFLVEQKNTDFKQLKITLTFSAAGSYLIEYTENGNFLSATDQWIGSAKMALSGDDIAIVSQIRCKADVSAGSAQSAYGEYLHYPTASGNGVVNHIGNFGDRLIATALASPLGGAATMNKAVVGWWVRTDAAGTVVMTISEPAMHKIPAFV